jgi:hypothetical protein
MKTRILTVGALLKQMQLTLLSFYTEVMTRKFYSDGQQFQVIFVDIGGIVDHHSMS